MYKLKVIILLLITIISCEVTSNKKENSEQESSFLIVKEKNKQKEHVDTYKKGINAIKQSDYKGYNEVIKQFEFNKLPVNEISLTELMIVKNCYNKAFYDIVTLYPYKKMHTLESENHLMFFLSIAKELGYKWKDSVEVFEKKYNVIRC